jgi:hypothetical protein
MDMQRLLLLGIVAYGAWLVIWRQQCGTPGAMSPACQQWTPPGAQTFFGQG